MPIISNFPSGSGSKGGIFPHITVIAPEGCTITITNSNTTLTPAEYDGVWEQNIPYFGTWTVTAELDGESLTPKTVNVVELTRYTVRFSEFEATIKVIAPAGATITCVGGGETQSILSTGEDAITVYAAGTYTVTRNKGGKIAERSIEVAEKGSTVPLVLSMRYGFRKKKTEGNPSARVEYLYDAVGMKPVGMNFTTGVFDYGDWGGEWFITKNRPVMLKSDLTEDYELDHTDHSKRLDGGSSDISNLGYDGNAMSAIPLCWFYRSEDAEYEYEVVCEHQWDDKYKAYAHTRADGTIEDYFYWSMFGGSGDANKIRSLADQVATAKLTAQNEIAGATANGEGWYIHTWSRRECIRTLLVLMGKSTNTQAVYGNGNCQSGKEGSVLQTGTLKNKGQFWGTTANNQQVKVFYIERFWGDQWDRTAGIINNSGPIFYKMTPENGGYRVTDVTGYTNSGITLGGTSGGYISATKCGEFGCIPTTLSGSDSTYECDGGWFNNGQLDYLIAGAGAANAPGFGGAFTFDVNDAPSAAVWNIGCGLSADMPAA